MQSELHFTVLSYQLVVLVVQLQRNFASYKSVAQVPSELGRVVALVVIRIVIPPQVIPRQKIKGQALVRVLIGKQFNHVDYLPLVPGIGHAGALENLVNLFVADESVALLE